MTRTQCEKAIARKMDEIVKILHKYSPTEEYISVTYMKKSDYYAIMIDNAHHHPIIDYYKAVSSDGGVYERSFEE